MCNEHADPVFIAPRWWRAGVEKVVSDDEQMGSTAHLAHRFFDVLTARRLDASEVAAIRGWLTPELQALFFAQQMPDQRHAYHAALLVVASGTTESDVVVAALTHDVGKRHARLGVFARSAVSILIRLGVSSGSRLIAYRDHGLIGARELAIAGAPSLAVDFAMHHQRGRPSSIPQPAWDILVAADQPPKAWASIRGWITSRQR
jgi:hypothetical protein